MKENSQRMDHKAVRLFCFFLAMGLTAFVVYIPYLKQGLPGHFVDMVYQMERIEGLKDALLSHTFPPRIYSRFFEGYGYASPLFYPDFFFLLPALLRILGLSVTQTWKLFVLFLILCNFTVTYFSLHGITKDFKASLTGAAVLVSCQFYICDLTLRAGLGEYIAIVLLPLLFLALYDYLCEEGKRTWLFGLVFGGMLLSHTIMVFLAAFFTVFIFIAALISPKYRKKVFVRVKIRRLLMTALATLGVTAYYFIPFLEQMASGKFSFSIPWVHLSDYLPTLASLFSLKGTMNFVCETGLGAALWLLVLYVILSFLWKNKNPEGLFLVLTGLIIAILTTDLFPWKYFDDTFFNSIQFTFRLLPYAVSPIVFGGVMSLSSDQGKVRKNVVLVLAFLLTLGFAVYQNFDLSNSELTYALSDDFLSGEGTLYAGKGEWLPAEIDIDTFEVSLATDQNGSSYVSCEAGILPLTLSSENTYTFEAVEDVTEYRPTVICYKGYEATLTLADGSTTELAVSKDPTGLILISSPDGLSGTVTLSYRGTVLQKVSCVITVLTVLLLAILLPLFRKKNNKKTALS